MLTTTNDNAARCEDDAELLQAIFHAKWRFRVLQELIHQPTRLSGLRRPIPACSKKVLIDTLHALEALKIVERISYETKVKKVSTACLATAPRTFAASSKALVDATSLSTDDHSQLPQQLYRSANAN